MREVLEHRFYQSLNLNIAISEKDGAEIRRISPLATDVADCLRVNLCDTFFIHNYLHWTCCFRYHCNYFCGVACNWNRTSSDWNSTSII